MEETARLIGDFAAQTRADALAKVHAALPHIFGRKLTMTKPTSLVEREIETKIQAAPQAEIAKGKKPSDMGVHDFNAVAKTFHGQVRRR
ncbi:hypothetical protein AB4144_14995 [Rhizobiaceae sp. 2RAB30]